MKSKWQKILSFLLAFFILVETSITPAAAIETQSDTESVDTEPVISEEIADLDSQEEEPSVIGEVKELRDESSKQFLLSDGTMAVAQYDTDVHYQDEAGTWQEIDNSLSSETGTDSSDVAGYATKEGRVSFKFAKNVNANFLVRVKQEKYHLYFSLPEAQKSSDGAKMIHMEDAVPTEDGSLADKMTAPHVQSGVIYEDILPSTDLEYITSGSSLKENIIVKERQEQYRYVFEIKTNKLDVSQEKDGSISFRAQDTGELLYVIPAMYMVDADGRESDQVSFQLSTKNKKSTLMITADAEWLNAEDRVFPVTIDPTLVSGSTSPKEEARIVQNQYVTKGHPSTTHAEYGRGFLGYDSSGNETYHLCYRRSIMPL